MMTDTSTWNSLFFNPVVTSPTKTAALTDSKGEGHRLNNVVIIAHLGRGHRTKDLKSSGFLATTRPKLE